MRNNIISFINGLFVGSVDCPANAELKEEIKSDALTHYDDLIAKGENENLAFAKVCAQIGDINELLAKNANASAEINQTVESDFSNTSTYDNEFKSSSNAQGAFSQEKQNFGAETNSQAASTGYSLPKAEKTTRYKVTRQIRKIIGIALCPATILFYLWISFATHQWAITWLVFLISCGIDGLASGILTLIGGEEDEKNED